MASDGECEDDGLGFWVGHEVFVFWFLFVKYMALFS